MIKYLGTQTNRQAPKGYNDKPINTFLGVRHYKNIYIDTKFKESKDTLENFENFIDELNKKVKESLKESLDEDYNYHCYGKIKFIDTNFKNESLFTNEPIKYKIILEIIVKQNKLIKKKENTK